MLQWRKEKKGFGAWRLAGLSSALAFPLDLGARPLCRRLRGRGCANCHVTQTSRRSTEDKEKTGSLFGAWPSWGLGSPAVYQAGFIHAAYLVLTLSLSPSHKRCICAP